MVMNVVHWVSDWQYAQKLKDLLREAEKGGMIFRLCFRGDGWACFRTKDKADDFLHSLSEQCTGEYIGHEWAAGDDCGASLWRDGKEQRCTPPRETPEWYAIDHSVNSKVKTWELCRDFHEKLYSCWERCTAEWHTLTSEQFRKQYVEIAATLLCFYSLNELSWHKTWIACLDQMEDPLVMVRDALLRMGSPDWQSNFETAVWDVIAKSANNHQQGQEQSV